MAAVPPIDELTRIEPIHLDRLVRQGVFTTGLLLEVSETPTRRQNLAGFGPTEHRLLMQAGFQGLRDILAVDLPTFRTRIHRGAVELKLEPPSDLTLEGWWEQARTLEEE
jgi:hypothetical protein